MILQLLVCIIFLFVLYACVSNRADDILVEMFLTLLSWVGGYFNVYFINDSHKDAKAIINQKWKGDALEYLMASPSWYPLINVESVDGPVWARMRSTVQELLATTDFETRIGPIVKEIVDRELKEDSRITNKVLTTLNMRIMWKLVFGLDASEQLCNEMCDLTDLLRGEIAQKTPSTERGQKLKAKMMKIVSETAATNPRVQHIWKKSEYEREFICSVLQPFFVSPFINITDIYVPLLNAVNETPCLQACLQDKHMTKNLIFESIFKSHPFPILERDLKKTIGKFKKGGHVYLLNIDASYKGDKWCPADWDNKDHDRQNRWKIFGCGPRMCVGSQLATVWLSELLFAMNEKVGLKNLVPWEGHRYSGRTNDDDENPFETLRRLGLAVWYRFQVLMKYRKSWFHEEHMYGPFTPWKVEDKAEAANAKVEDKTAGLAQAPAQTAI